MAQVCRRRPPIAAALSALAAVIFTPALAQDQPKKGTDLCDRPVLAVDSGMHSGIIKSLAVDANGHFAVTGSGAWPCGSARRMRIPSAATATPPFSSVRKPSTSGVGQAVRLARVRFLTRPSSRKLSRNRMAGGEPRLGTDSIYMALLLTLHNHCR
jgi:hypothetical protein